MFTARTAIPSLFVILLAFALSACGDDEDDDPGRSARTAQTATAESTAPPTETSAPDRAGPANNPRAKELTSCLEDQRLTVFVNAGSQVDAEYQLVIDAGSGGVLYGYSDAAAANAAKGRVDENEGSAGRETEVIEDTVFAFFPTGHSLARPEKSTKVRACARG